MLRCIGRKELADEITVTGVHFDAVKTGAATKVNCFAEIFHNLVDVLDGHLARESWRIKVEAPRRGERFLTAGGTVRHVAAVPDLDGSLRTLCMDSIGQLL